MKKIQLAILLFTPVFAGAQIITTIAGNGTVGYSGDGGPATTAQLGIVWTAVPDGNGNLYISTSEVVHPTIEYSVIRKVNASGIISTFAGTDTIGYAGDGGPATAAMLNFVLGLAVDNKGNLYIDDNDGNCRIRKVDTTGIITTFAGISLSPGYGGDGGPATAARLSGGGSSGGICMDASGNLYFGDGSRIRKVDTNGIISTFAGTGVSGYSGDGGPATAAQFKAVLSLNADHYKNIYFVDVNRIRKIDSFGIITTVLGNGTAGFSGDGGLATVAEILPSGICSDDCDNIFIAEAGNERIRLVNSLGYINTIAGNGTIGYSGDGGPATAAEFYGPRSINLDDKGNIYISDVDNFRVRYIRLDSCLKIAYTNEVHTPVLLKGDINIYPNPATTQLTIQYSQLINEVSITNLLGQTVYQTSSIQYQASSIKIDVADFAPGVYFLKVNGTEVRKFVKE